MSQGIGTFAPEKLEKDVGGRGRGEGGHDVSYQGGRTFNGGGGFVGNI